MNTRLKEIETRLSAIKAEIDTEGADIRALSEETDSLIEERNSILSKIEERKTTLNKIANFEICEKEERIIVEPKETKAYDASSPEYRSAFLKNLLDIDMTKEERAAFTHTTANTAGVLPAQMLNNIWDLVSGQHSILEDITVYRTGTILEVVKHTEIVQGKAKKVSEATANDDEKNTFIKVTLSGNDFSKSIDISYAEAKMSIDALESYLTNEIASGIGEAMAEDAIETIQSGINANNKITSKAANFEFKEIAELFGKLKRVNAVTLYATRATIYNQLVSMVDNNGRPIFQPSAQAGQEGVILGASIKVEDSVAEGTILIGDPKKVVYNMIQDIMIETDRDIKKHTYTYSGYARGEGALIDDVAFASLSVPSAE